MNGGDLHDGLFWYTNIFNWMSIYSYRLWELMYFISFLWLSCMRNCSVDFECIDNRCDLCTFYDEINIRCMSYQVNKLE